MQLNNPFHIEISRRFLHMDKYFLSLWAGAKINCKTVASHKWQWGWVVDQNKIALNYLLWNPYCKLNSIYFVTSSIIGFQKYAYPLFTLIHTDEHSFTEVTYARKYQQESCIILSFNKKIISVPARFYIFVSFCKRKLLLLWTLCYKWISGKHASFRGTF